MRELYERDHYLWIVKTASLLRDRQWDLIDWEHLLEEIDDMGKDKRRELKSRLQVLLMHLLKYQYQPQRRSSSWVSTILEQRRQIEYLLADSPSLKPFYREIFLACYGDAIRDASIETKLPAKSFPVEPPFLPEQIIDIDFIENLLNPS